jgi:predicted O-methyltransferase YrrM
MDRFFARLQSNLRVRLRLIKGALGARYVWPDILALAREHTSEFREVAGNVDPLEFARTVFEKNGNGMPAPPDFSDKLGEASSFTPSGAPDTANSEASVGRFLSQLVFYRKPAVVVELGCLGGWTSAHVASMLKVNGQGRLFCVDCEAHHLEVTMANMKRLELDNFVTPLHGTSLAPTVLKSLPAAIDVLFIDSSHDYLETLEELRIYSPRMTEGGCIVMHDTISHSSLRRSIADVAAKFRILTFATERGNGVSILVGSKSCA